MDPLFDRLSPVPSFPAYTGPYKVGTIDVELPISRLTSPSPAPEGAEDIHTVLFRVYYPAISSSDDRPITWLPAPQRLHLNFYTQFLGLGPLAAELFSFLPRYLHYITIPVHKNADLLPPPAGSESRRWPTIIFSHGLGGSRNAYSHLAGSLASHGVVVICPEHRDGTAIVSLVRNPESTLFLKLPSKVFPCIRIPHSDSPEIWAARDKQMRIRLWELGLIHEAILAVDRGDFHILHFNMNETTPGTALSQFRGKLDIQEPGKIIFGGHSFGAATVIQLLKSTYYVDRPQVSDMAAPFFTPSKDSAIRRQITEKTPSFLLDTWCFPLLSTAAKPLADLPLPVYDHSKPSSAPGGKAILAVGSEGFFKWKKHLHYTARFLSADPTEKTVSAESFVIKGSEEENKDGAEQRQLSEPHFFYVKDSAHLGQSDFGLLFPWLTKKVFQGKNPERVMRLNVRAVLQFLRENSVSSLAKTGPKDLVEGGAPTPEGEKAAVVRDDKAILAKDNNAVEAWVPIKVVGLGGEAGPDEIEFVAGTVSKAEAEKSEEDEKKMQAEMEPGFKDDKGEKGIKGLDDIIEDAPHFEPSPVLMGLMSFFILFKLFGGLYLLSSLVLAFATVLPFSVTLRW
ncbi:platelet-activating factor acetylhydrolase, isoform II-domain-containing protein [Rhypophila decipiens]|uniref:Putative phospholipase n=1 Tax=Rhypophila decipiens TaxID=261697 RepID=A0AAN6YJG4_9PEZI|nr:platelet-activating factor acetylhydrolase, isoform II-domain-containing protein [Rhypophila decipiens]